MGNFTLYLKDYGAGAAYTTFQASCWTNGSNATHSQGRGVAQIETADAYVNYIFASTTKLGDVGLFNHNLSGGTLYFTYAGTPVGDPQSITSNADTIFTFSAAGVEQNSFRVKVTGCAGKQIGGISLIGRDAGQVVQFVDAWATYPIGQTFDAAITNAETAAGYIMQQKHGGSYRTFGIDFDHIAINDTTAAQEGMLDDYFLEESYGVQGFMGPCWLRDDNSKDYYGNIILPIDMPITQAGAHARGRFTFRTVPKSGVS